MRITIDRGKKTGIDVGSKLEKEASGASGEGGKKSLMNWVKKKEEG